MCMRRALRPQPTDDYLQPAAHRTPRLQDVCWTGHLHLVLAHHQWHLKVAALPIVQPDTTDEWVSQHDPESQHRSCHPE
jgi:hypothetical protein